jgi:GT2 family glycosyltransferase
MWSEFMSGSLSTVEPKIGIVTITYNSASCIEDFLRCSLNQSFQNFLLIIVDNNSTDDTVSRINDCSDERIHLIQNSENYGVARGNNIGSEFAISELCDYVMLINNDTEFDETLFAGLFAAMEQFNVSVIVPKIHYFEPKGMIWYAGGNFKPVRGWYVDHYGLDIVDTGQFDDIKTVRYAPTCCMLVKASVFSLVGMMDEKYFVYHDDSDFCFRLGKRNIEILYFPKTILIHKASSLTGGSQTNFSIYYLSRNAMYFAKKNLGLYFYIALVIEQVLIVVKAITFQEKFSVLKLRQKAFFDGIRM